MKKLIFVMPLMAVSLLASCNKSVNLGDPIPLEECSWKKISQVSKAGKASEWFRIGDTKTINVDGFSHKARIIGFNQDVDINNKKIGITFEFANLISDDHGYSIVTQWNDTNDETTANHNYLDSSIRKALTNEGNGHILWAQKEETAWSDDYKKSILEMLPDDLTKALVAPKKTIQCYENVRWIDEPIVNSKGEYDKLFLLSAEEMGYNADRSGAYTYYQESDDDKIKHLRVKKQVLNEQYVGYSEITYDPNSGQIYEDHVWNCAGNNEISEIEGGFYWLRSPYTSSACCAWSVGFNGFLHNSEEVYIETNAVAPAFCI